MQLAEICGMTLSAQLDTLASFEPAPYPVVSLYLDARPGQTGRDQFQPFIKKELTGRLRTYAPHSPERQSLERDLARISRYLEVDVQPSSNGIALFACSAADLFEAVQLAAPFEQHWLTIGDRPHLYPLARVDSRYPRAAALVADTHDARILVISSGELVAEREITGVKTRRTSQGGWSQARYQRHVENFHLHHAKEVIEALDRIVQQEELTQIVIAGDEVITPLIRDQMPKHLAEKVVDHLRLDTYAPVKEVIDATLAAMARAQERTDREQVEAAIGAYRAGGLGVAGPEATLDALVKGQVEELLISASLRDIRQPHASTSANDTGVQTEVEVATAGEPAQAEPDVVRLSDELVTRARQTAARITFVEDASLLADVGGVAALLRFRI
jgi:peptide chain release factor subunit 1